MQEKEMSLEKLRQRWPQEVAQFLEREMAKAAAAKQSNDNVIEFLKRISE